MRHPIDERPDSDPADAAPAELRELEAELLAIRIEERASFAPELEAELERAGCALLLQHRNPEQQLVGAERGVEAIYREGDEREKGEQRGAGKP